ncbi:hypothetical protein [uncultured Chryseobacterium sp.]|uniref:hypothetical protein n=1 Tax=uncultured Chryseobacterium sp. TaxID=259322 RepID=UPI0025CFA485|nr:hypothetical protein [uncultured Chryseobacterium sp.]
MSQNITCLIIKEDSGIINKSINQIRLDGFIFIRFKDDFKTFIKNARDFDELEVYLDYVKSRYDFEEDDTVQDLVRIIEEYKLDTFILEHYFEFGDIPVCHFFMMVEDGKIINESLVFDDEFSADNYSSVQDYHFQFGLHFNWLLRTDLW